MLILLLNIGPSQQVLIGVIQTVLAIRPIGRLAADLPLMLHTPLRDERAIHRLEKYGAIAMADATSSASNGQRGQNRKCHL
jgi:hypothetical protein